MREQQRAPVAIFERYYANEYAQKRVWRAEKGGFTRMGLLPATGQRETQKIGYEWNADESEVASCYYKEAENNCDIFWDPNSIFYHYFMQLDCTSIVELACGHGRHVPYYIANAKNIILVDINEENINFCKSRFSMESNISYVVTMGNGFPGVEENSQTAIFSYDAMVHF